MKTCEVKTCQKSEDSVWSLLWAICRPVDSLTLWWLSNSISEAAASANARSMAPSESRLISVSSFNLFSLSVPMLGPVGPCPEWQPWNFFELLFTASKTWQENARCDLLTQLLHMLGNQKLRLQTLPPARHPLPLPPRTRPAPHRTSPRVSWAWRSFHVFFAKVFFRRNQTAWWLGLVKTPAAAAPSPSPCAWELCRLKNDGVLPLHSHSQLLRLLLLLLCELLVLFRLFQGLQSGLLPLLLLQ